VRAFFISGVAFAGCPDSLNSENMVECITVEDSGANYQDWQKNEYLFNLDTSAEASSTVSPIAGIDGTLEPTAGAKMK
jgi:hypothetical protein